MTVRNKNIPALRFKGFDGEWKLKKLDAVSEKVNSGKTPLGGQSVYVPSGVLFIRSQNVLDSQLSFDNSTYITEEVNSSMKNSIVKPNDILLNITGASLGRSSVVPKEFTTGNVNQHVCIVRLNKENDPYFLQPIFASEKGQNLFTSLQTGSGREGLNFQSIKNLSLSFPSLPEQQKIASFLSAIDEKIRQLTRRKELLEQYKKGVMQQLFSGNLRFKQADGKAYPKWEEKRLGDVCVVNPKSNGLPDSFIYIDLESVEKGQLKMENRINKVDAPSRAQRKMNKNDILYQTVRPYQMNNFFFNKSGDYVASTGYAQLRTKESPRFIYQLIHTDSFVNEVLDRCTGTSFPAIKSTDLAQIKIKIPNIEEQDKIASFLSSIDIKIESISAQITKTQLFKKGLLQQMFV
jgi:type I restriction enzyme S subunit